MRPNPLSLFLSPSSSVFCFFLCLLFEREGEMAGIVPRGGDLGIGETAPRPYSAFLGGWGTGAAPLWFNGGALHCYRGPGGWPRQSALWRWGGPKRPKRGGWAEGARYFRAGPEGSHFPIPPLNWEFGAGFKKRWFPRCFLQCFRKEKTRFLFNGLQFIELHVFGKKKRFTFQITQGKPNKAVFDFTRAPRTGGWGNSRAKLGKRRR